MRKRLIAFCLISTALLLSGCVDESKMEENQIGYIKQDLVENKEDIANAKIKRVDKDIYTVKIGNKEEEYYIIKYPRGRLFTISYYEIDKYRPKD